MKIKSNNTPRNNNLQTKTDACFGCKQLLSNSLNNYLAENGLSLFCCSLLMILGLSISSCMHSTARNESNSALKFEQQNHNFVFLDYEVPGSVAFNNEEHEVLHWKYKW
jgi:hypothetical protein